MDNTARTLEDKLISQIYERRGQKGYRLGKSDFIIIMHPETWQRLVEEVFSNNSSSISRHENHPCKFQDINVMRSFDVSKEKFIVK